MSCRRCRARPFNLDPTVKLSFVFFRFAFITLHVRHNFLEYVGASGRGAELLCTFMCTFHLCEHGRWKLDMSLSVYI